ncbi:hypothetical protein BH24BAC1_BH24BAC1_35890 [soil metagenome]
MFYKRNIIMVKKARLQTSQSPETKLYKAFNGSLGKMLGKCQMLG